MLPFFLIARLVASSSCSRESAPPTTSWILRGATVIDGTGARPIEDAVVVVDKDRIVSVGPAGGIDPPEEAKVSDFLGKWILPGMIDVHAHFLDSGSLYTSPDDYDLRAYVPHEEERERIRKRIPYTLSRYLCAGVTTVVSLGGPSWELDLRDIAAGSNAAPRVATSGPFISSFPVGEFTLWTEEDPVLIQARSPDEGRALVRGVARKGVDLIKTGFAVAPEHTLEDFLPILDAIIDESHAQGLRVAVHAEEVAPAKAAVRLGCDILAHTVSDQPVDDELIQLMRDRGVLAVTGLGARARYADVLRQRVELLDVERACGDAEVTRSWDDLERIPVEERPPVPEWIRTGSSPRAQGILLENARRLHEAGIPLAVGSNGGTIGTLHGASFHRELQLMAEAGIPALDIIVAATRNGAFAMSRDPDRGTLEPGKLADMIIINADPLANVLNLGRIHAVIKGGRLLDHNELLSRELPREESR
ncbi:MAG: amidohydrolase family protein [Acidobacteriota bacterium]